MIKKLKFNDPSDEEHRRALFQPSEFQKDVFLISSLYVMGKV